jgi:hypothetical protein
MLRNAVENSVIADWCHVARACGYRSNVGTDDLSVSLPSHRSNICVTTEVLSDVVMWDVSPYNLIYSYESCSRTCRCSTILQTTGLSTKLQGFTSQETFILTRNGVRRQTSDAICCVPCTYPNSVNGTLGTDKIDR